MTMKNAKVFCFIPKLFLFLQLCNCKNSEERTGLEIGTAMTQFQSDEDLDLKARMVKIEVKSNLQDQEITILKSNAVKHKEVINQLEGRVFLLEASVINLKKTADRKVRRNKRPYRLLPPKHRTVDTIQNETKGEILWNQPFYGPPTNCYELGKLGYTLNGYYLVKGDYFSKTNKVVVVYCSFKQPNLIKDVKTLPIGEVNIKTRSVHFFVQRKTFFSGHNVTIPFEIERLNVGGAVNLSTGMFTAPVAGIYHFEFSGSKDFSSGYLEVFLQLNGIKISYTSVGKWGSDASSDFTALSGIHASLWLKMGDRVNLMKRGPAPLANSDGYYNTFFTGSLLEEDIEVA